jgi:hypothetical protein
VNATDHDAGKRSAVRNKSGLPVDHSGPELGVGPTTPPTSGRTPEACPPDLDSSQHKSGRRSRRQSLLGAGKASPGLRSQAEQPPLLDQVEINRNITGRGKHCGRFSVFGRDLSTGAVKFHRVNCKCWNCSYCAPRKAKRYKRAIRATAQRLKLCRFITLTLDPAKIQGDPVRYLNATWAKLRVYLKREFGAVPVYIRVLEFQKNGNPHFHILVDRYIDWRWLQSAWQSVGGGLFVNAKFVDVHRVARYVSKYLTKELLMSAPLRSRRVTTSRGIHLQEKQPSETTWEFLRVPLLVLFDRLKAFVIALELDEESALKSFSIMNNFGPGPRATT